MAQRLTAAIAGWLAAFAPAQVPAQTAATEGLIVVYGALAPSREGDTDLREQIFFSVPADTSGRLYVRLFDPEVHGASDFTYGGTGNSLTTFRVFGGDGAFSQAERPTRVEDRDRAARAVTAPVTGPGSILAEESYGNDRSTDGRWVNLTALRARQGEVIDGRAYFRLDVQGTGGDDGNGFSVGVSLARDRDRAPEGLEMFSYQPTIRWTQGSAPTTVGFAPTGEGPYAVQTFDAANGDVAILTDHADLPVRVSGQDFWTVDSVTTDETNLALSLSGGFETPNDVTVAVFDANGMAMALRMPPVPSPLPARPTVAATGRPLADCRSVAFDGSASRGLTPLGYQWDFGDGRSSREPVIAHRYDAPGRYVARLRVIEEGTRPGRGAQMEVPVHVRPAPVARPGADIVVAPGQEVAFDGTGSQPSDSPIARYSWSFGDGTLAQGPRASKVYAQPGLYRAVLRVEDDSNHPCNFGVETRRVTVNAPPVAEAGTDQSAVVGQPVVFSGAASYDIDGLVQEFSWNMGDGTVLTGANVTHAFQGSGVFNVVLTVTDDSGVANATATDVMQVEVNAPPQPRFEIPPRPVSVSEVALLDASGSTDADGTILSYMWDFGDGATGEGQVVDYAWTRPGIFTVTLTVTDDSGTASAVQFVRREIRIDAAPIANAGPDQFVTASEVGFSGRASVDPDGVVTSYEWDFGDGNTATGPEVRHAFVRPGLYEVALVVRDNSGAPLNTDRDTMMVVVNSAPIADAGPPQVVAPDEEFTVSGRASVDPDGSISEYVWDFPDGSTARGELAALKIAEPGLHRIRLTVYDSFPGGAASDEAETLITVNAPPVAVAGADRLVAPGDLLVFDAGQSFDPDGRLVSYRWEFDDLGAPIDAPTVERAYDTPGVWSAQLIVTDDSGVLNSTASDDITIRVNHTPVAEAGPPVDTDRLYVELDGSASSDADGDALIYRWDLGDGSPPVLGARVKHVYPRSGRFPVTLWVDDGTGLSNARAVDATVVTIKARPLADAGDNREVCSGEPILFDASGSVDPDGGLLLYSWDFGDGSTSDLINPSKTYEQPGVYPVTLSVQNESGLASGRAVDRIAALVREGPIADAGPDLKVCTNQRVRFDGSGSTDADGAVNAFAWTFGDGGSASGDQPVYIFKRPGNYAVTLTITGEARGACSPLDTDVTNVEVVLAPEQTILGPERASAGLPSAYSAGLGQLNGASVVSHNWSFSDGGTATGSEVSHSFTAPGEYLVTLVTELAGGNPGCSTIETVRKVIVNEAPMPAIDSPDTVAAGEAVVFDAGQSSDADGAITGFAWDFGDGATAQGVLVAHRFAAAGTYDVRLTVTDDAGVANSNAVMTRRVVVNPSPVAGLAAPAPVCPAVPVAWTVSTSPETSVDWRFGAVDAASGTSVSHIFDKAGLFPVSVTLDDGAGLPNSRRMEEVYVRVNAAPTALAGPDRTVCPGDTVAFDAGRSSDLDGRIVEWEWAFDDGIVLSGERLERVFDTPGEVGVRLTVRDDSGATACGSASDEARVLVNGTPVVNAGPDMSVPVGAAHDIVRFDATDATDPDGQGLRITWDFGDGTRTNGAVVRHRYGGPGSYTVTVRAQDTTGLACGIGTDTAIVQAIPRE